MVSKSNNPTAELIQPGVNTLKCPRHKHWLYRRENVDAKPGARWCRGVEGCDYGYDASTECAPSTKGARPIACSERLVKVFVDSGFARLATALDDTNCAIQYRRAGPQ